MIKTGFWKELEELKKEDGDANFSFMKNIEVREYDRTNAYRFLHGDCAEFAAMLNKIYGYKIECIRYSNKDEDYGNKLIHAYCVSKKNGEKLYIDVRGITSDPAEFFKEFSSDLMCYQGKYYTQGEYEYRTFPKTYSGPNDAFDEVYTEWDDEDLKKFIMDYRDYYDVKRIKEKGLKMNNYNEVNRKFVVRVKVQGYVEVEVEADNFDEAFEKACGEVCEMDFGDLENVDWEAVNAEDEKGIFIEYGVKRIDVDLDKAIKNVEKRERNEDTKTKEVEENIER